MTYTVCILFISRRGDWERDKEWQPLESRRV